MLLPDDEHVYAFRRSLPGSPRGTELLVLGNFSGEERSAELGDDGWSGNGAELVLGNYPAGNSPAGAAAASAAGAHAAADAAALSDAGAVRLRPWELRVLRRTSTSDSTAQEGSTA
jgi:oligo-1,6-glucosidase